MHSKNSENNINNGNSQLLRMLIVLCPLVLTFALALDIYLPIIPKMMKIMDTSHEKIQLTLSLYVLVLGIGQLFLGPLSDQIGRKKVIIFSICLFFIGSVACALSNSINSLIISRAIQALGACGCMVTSFSVVRDSFNETEIGKAYSYLNSSIYIAPMLAPFIGAYIDLYCGWRFIFWFLCLFAMGTLLLSVFLFKETLSFSKRVSMSNSLLNRYKNILLNADFQFYTYCVASSIACIFTFFSVSPHIIITSLKMTEQYFGFFFSSIGLLLLISGFISGIFIKKLKIHIMTLLGCVTLFSGGLIMAVWYVFFGLSTMCVIIPMYVATIGISIVLGASIAGALMPFAHIAGSASAVIGCCQFMLAFIVSTFVMKLQFLTPLPLAYTFMIFPSIAIIWYLLRKRNIN